VSSPASGEGAGLAAYLRDCVARLESESHELRRWSTEIDAALEVARACVALLPEEEGGDELFAPAPTASGAAGQGALAAPPSPARIPAAAARAADPTAVPLPPLTVRMLGEFRLLRGDEEIRLAHGSKVSRLIKLLLLRGGGPLAHDVLVDTFWPRAREAAGSQSLYSAIHAARRLLGGEDRHNYLVCSAGIYRIAPGAAISTDVSAFERALARARTARVGGDLQGGIEALEAASACYGGALLPEEPYERWAADQREHLAARHADSLAELAHLCALAGDLDRASECCRRVLEHDPLREETHRSLIEIHGRSGRRDLAAQQFKLLRKLLRRDLGVEPERKSFQALETALGVRPGIPSPGARNSRAAQPR
jgi:DNA-binding SARP family transcriptional activator